LPELQQVADAAPDIELITVLVGGEPARANSVAGHRGLTAPILLDDGALRRLFAVDRTPMTFVIRDGRVARALVGEQSRRSIERALADERERAAN
jgi:hypothetical protein